jgi:hypothetical protein
MSPTTKHRRRPVRSPRLAVRLAAAVLPLSLVAGCGRDTTGYTGPFEAEVRRAIPEIESVAGLTFKTPPVLEVRTRDEAREFLERQFNEQTTPLELAGTQQAYRRFGLLPDTLDLRAFLLDVLTEQVAGYYDPGTKVLYVVTGAPTDMTGVTIRHELVHALQDQYVSLDAARGLKGDNDRQLAHQAVMEGHATYEQMSSSLGGDFGLRFPGGFDRIRESIRDNQATMPLLARAPTLIQETLLFPYVAGINYAREVKLGRPDRPPFSPPAASTEQILHPERVLADTPDVPTRVTLAAPRGGTIIYENNLGEFETRLFLHEHLADAGIASRAAAGWDGDRYQLVNTPRGDGLAWVTVWDSPVEAAEFRDAMERMVERRFGARAGSGGTAATRRWTLRGRSLLVSAEQVAGRPAVIFEDLPAGVTSRVLDAARITLQEP